MVRNTGLTLICTATVSASATTPTQAQVTIKTSPHDSGNTEAASTTNTRNVFKGPGFVKHIYILTQQDDFSASGGSVLDRESANWNEADVSFYDTSTVTYADLGLPIYKQVIPMGIPDGFFNGVPLEGSHIRPTLGYIRNSYVDEL